MQKNNSFSTLNATELGVLKLIVGGNTTGEIAVKYKLSKSRIGQIRQSIHAKSHTKGVAELVKAAIQEGVVRL